MARRKAYHQAATLLRLLFAGLIPTAAPLLETMPAHAATPATVGGRFSLAAPNGTIVTDKSFRGKWMLVFFGYTFCPDTCPTTLGQIAVALDLLGPEAKRVQPIFITVDPERDTPKVMGEYTEEIDKRIVGLSGTPEQIAAISQAYGVYSEWHRTGPGRDDYLIDHSTYIYIMSPEGKFVRGVSADTPGDAIAAILRHLMTEARNRG
ncbi:SCO family protein [Rhizobium sullae]|uniref:SCO family protein n=1 Tax=Rhizobium sullae TaxID=50338 RepID=UPI000B360158|nr:SCO family protein [Rhizobium sullae]